jgi:hypothetical protein
MPPSLSLGWHDIEKNASLVIANVRAEDRQVISYLGGSAAVVVPFGPMATVTTSDDHVLAGQTDVPEIRIYGRHGGLERIVRWSATPERLTTADRKQYETLRLQLDTLVRRGTTAQTPSLEEFDLPVVKPLFVQVIADDEGFIWVRKYPKMWDGFERIDQTLNGFESEWWLFAPSGELLGTVSVPRGIVVKDIRNGTILGVRPDRVSTLEVLVAPIRSEVLRSARAHR